MTEWVTLVIAGIYFMLLIVLPQTHSVMGGALLRPMDIVERFGTVASRNDGVGVNLLAVVGVDSSLAGVDKDLNFFCV